MRKSPQFIIECLWETKLQTKCLDVSTPPNNKSNYMNFKYSENETIREKALKQFERVPHHRHQFL